MIHRSNITNFARRELSFKITPTPKTMTLELRDHQKKLQLEFPGHRETPKLSAFGLSSREPLKAVLEAQELLDRVVAWSSDNRVMWFQSSVFLSSHQGEVRASTERGPQIAIDPSEIYRLYPKSLANYENGAVKLSFWAPRGQELECLVYQQKVYKLDQDTGYLLDHPHDLAFLSALAQELKEKSLANDLLVQMQGLTRELLLDPAKALRA